MLTRKQILAQKRQLLVNQRKQKNRELFVKRILRRKGIWMPAEDETECFRGYNTLLTRIFTIAKCKIGVIAGCQFCKYADQAFQEISNFHYQNLPFKCRGMNYDKPKLVIIPDTLPIVTIPCIYHVPRPEREDAHGHIRVPPRAPPPRPDVPRLNMEAARDLIQRLGRGEAVQLPEGNFEVPNEVAEEFIAQGLARPVEEDPGDF